MEDNISEAVGTCLKREMEDWITRMRSEMQREMNSNDTGEDLILMVLRMMMSWKMMTSTRNDVATVTADSIVFKSVVSLAKVLDGWLLFIIICLHLILEKLYFLK